MVLLVSWAELLKLLDFSVYDLLRLLWQVQLLQLGLQLFYLTLAFLFSSRTWILTVLALLDLFLEGFYLHQMSSFERNLLDYEVRNYFHARLYIVLI